MERGRALHCIFGVRTRDIPMFSICTGEAQGAGASIAYCIVLHKSLHILNGMDPHS